MNQFDVIVIGSGAAGLTAALSAAVGGARVAVLEGSPHWGGSTAVSGAQAWVPGHHLVSDDRAAALRYLRAHTQQRPDAHLETFVDSAPRMARFVAAHSPIDWQVTGIPDSLAEGPGGMTSGRVLEPRPVVLGELGTPEDLFWPADYPQVLTNEEVSAARLIVGGEPPMGLIGERMEAGQVAMGQGLIAGLLRGCLDAGVTARRRHRVIGLTDTAPRVVVTEAGELSANRVILACGGFEHDAPLRRQLLAGPYDGPVSPPVAHGTALRLGGGLGAAMAFLSESWSWPVRRSPHGWSDGSDRYGLAITERMLPHTIWVNRRARRFVNESSHNCAAAFADLDSATGQPLHMPAWLLADNQYRQRYPLAGAGSGHPLPGDVIHADNLSELATAMGVDPGQLNATVERFNAQARQGEDIDFQRGSFAYDRHGGDPTAPHPNLGELSEPPFFATPLAAGMVGTKGGLRTDTRARVLNWDDEPIAGLYAAGNAAAAIIGPGTISPGATIGAALTWGWIAGEHAAT